VALVKIILWVLVVIIIALGVIAIAAAVPHTQPAPTTASGSSTIVQTQSTTPAPGGGNYNQVTLKAGNATVVADVSDTDILRQQGLSGRTSLSDGTGMWFEFDTDGSYGFWMKDMQFSIDMVWVNSSYTVVTVAANVSPDSYFKENPPEVFYPTTAARYVLELPAGYAAAHGIADGTQIVVQ
jgi:uncharacterized membrane protein (UPF0127 family)